MLWGTRDPPFPHANIKQAGQTDGGRGWRGRAYVGTGGRGWRARLAGGADACLGFARAGVRDRGVGLKIAAAGDGRVVNPTTFPQSHVLLFTSPPAFFFTSPSPACVARNPRYFNPLCP